MAEPKTTRNSEDVATYLATVTDAKRRADAEAACALMAEVTGAEPTMWGSAIIGFGTYHYKYASGREGDWPAVALSPRKQALTLYLSSGFEGYDDLMSRLGPHRTGKSCLYLKRLADVDQDVLRELVEGAFQHINGRTLDSEPT
ncbi:DUF1801 domain-containing protein [Actinoplanes sp. NPDC024001]|uniref:DUF1801 domain-containing protein n=1 Tax=Actinoplanes sp. NPDC024001 TaxID=3154598 RepID=UPI0033DB3C23